MSNRYSKAKGRRASYSDFFGVPKEVLRHENFKMLSTQANKLLLDLGEQYGGFNNGDLCATWSFMVKRGWKSKETLNDALRELEYYGLIVTTQFGGLNLPSLYAFSWKRIDKATKTCGWSEGDTPKTWKQVKPKFLKPSRQRRKKKKQERIAGERGTECRAVRDKLRVIR